MNTTLTPKKRNPAQSASGEDAHSRPEWRNVHIQSGQTRRDMHVWRKLRSTGLLGVVLGVPTALGMASGLWIDTLWPSSQSWFSILSPIGLGLGCISAVLWSCVDQNKASKS